MLMDISVFPDCPLSNDKSVFAVLGLPNLGSARCGDSSQRRSSHVSYSELDQLRLVSLNNTQHSFPSPDVLTQRPTNPRLPVGVVPSLHIDACCFCKLTPVSARTLYPDHDQSPADVRATTRFPDLSILQRLVRKDPP